MVTRFGMSDRLGPLAFGRPATLRFLDGSAEERNYSFGTKRRQLVAIADALLAKETLDRDELLSLVFGSQGRMSIEPTPKVGAVS